MQTSKLPRDVWKYLAILLLLAAMVTAVFTARESAARPGGNRGEGAIPIGPFTVLGEVDPCGSGVLLSLPPKCKTLEGSYVYPEGYEPFIPVTPETK